MSKYLLRAVTVFAICAMMAGSAWAQGRGHGRPASSTQAWHGDRDGDRDFGRDWRGDRDRWTFGNDQRPRGWDKGKKTGWGNCDVPPGQAKKMGCTPVSLVFNTRSRRLRDRDRDGDHDRDRRHR